MITGKVIQFRRGKHTYKPKHFLIEVEVSKNRKDAEKLVGKDVEWKSPAGKIIKGKISGAHGNKGAVRAIFEKGLPGQAITTGVEIK
ncbi:MAG: 50S ribosomal protein L35ae [Nanoarchaeota archaeon]|nr:50S ribosomal protein L35ae [Nanoarchaeota archaeon]